MEKRVALRNYLKDKRGVELTLNTVIISILVVLVLVVIIAFFLGGTTKAKGTIAEIYNVGSAGADIEQAILLCNNYCDQARDWNPTLQTNSPYCTKAFKLDLDGDGEADKIESTGGYEEYYCAGSTLNVRCPDILNTPGVTCKTEDVVAN